MGLGFKDFGSEMLTSSDVDGYLMRQTIMAFADTSTRDTALTGVLEEGMFAYTTAGDALWFYNGSTWVCVFSQWYSYTPAWTNLAIGSATQIGRYRYLNGDMRVRGQITFAGDTTVGGVIAQTIPNSETADTSWQGGVGLANDASAALIYPLIVGVNPSATSWNWVGPTGALVSTTAPMTWATSDVLTWDFTVGLTG